MDFAPSWVWDCDVESQSEKLLPDGSVVTTKYLRGAPPFWLLKRMVKKGIKVLNLDKYLIDRKYKGVLRGQVASSPPLPPQQ